MRATRCSLLAGVILGTFGVAGTAQDAKALINLQFRPLNQVVPVGSTFGVGLYAVSDSEMPQLLSVLQTIFTWDTAFVHLDGATPVAPLSLSGFIGDSYGLNASITDGNAIYFAFDQPGNPIPALSTGTLIATLNFTALAVTPSTPVNMLATAGNPTGATMVLDGTVPNTNVTGTLMGSTVTIVVPAPASAGLLALGSLAALRRRRR